VERDLDVRPTAAMSGVRSSRRERSGALENIRISGLIISVRRSTGLEARPSPTLACRAESNLFHHHDLTSNLV
jgi:hypothetical protein